MWRGRKVLVTGGTGLIGRPLVKRLVAAGAQVRVASLHEHADLEPGVEYVRGDLTQREFCAEAVRGVEDVFHLASVRGSVALGRKAAADFFVKPLLLNTHMMEEARKGGVERYLFASSICVYGPAELFFEDRAWDQPPHPSDAFAGWAKRMGELQAAAYREQYGWNAIAIVRPVNVYGPHDTFEPPAAQVIPSLIRRAIGGENPFRVWGDGTAVRDFLYSDDAARGILLAMEKYTCGTPVNLGSGIGYSIRQVVETVLEVAAASPEVEWDTSKPSGERYRVADVSRAKTVLQFEPEVSLKEGIARTSAWYRENKDRLGSRRTAFD